MRFLSSLLGAKRFHNPWIKAVFFLGVLGFACFCFSDAAAQIAAGIFGKLLHPTRFFAAACVVILVYAAGLYWIVASWLGASKAKRKEGERHG